MNNKIITKIRTFVEMEITEEDLEINKLDNKIYKISHSVGQEMFSKSLEAIEGYLLKEKRDKKIKPIHSHKKGYLETLVGPVDTVMQK